MEGFTAEAITAIYFIAAFLMKPEPAKSYARGFSHR
jgi:hypothetical protein